MKIIKFAAFMLAGSLALVATRVQAAAAAYPISLSFTTYNQVTSTDSLGVITFSTTSTTWNNATILAKLQGMGITLPGNPRLAVIKGGDIVVLDSAGNIALNLDGYYSSGGYEVYLYLDDISAEAQTIKSAKLSSTVQYIGTASLYADFVTYSNEVSATVVKHGGFFTSNEDAFDFFSLGISGSFTRAAPYSGTSNIPSVPISGNMTVWGAGEYYHFDNVSGMDIYQAADMTASIPLISGYQTDTILATFIYAY